MEDLEVAEDEAVEMLEAAFGLLTDAMEDLSNRSKTRTLSAREERLLERYVTLMLWMEKNG